MAAAAMVNNGPYAISPDESQRILQSIYPKAAYAQNYSPEGKFYSQYRTATDPTTGKVVPTSWGSNDAYGNYAASYIAPGYQSNYFGDAPSGGPAATKAAGGFDWTPAVNFNTTTPAATAQTGTSGAQILPVAKDTSGKTAGASDKASSDKSAPAAAAPSPWDLWQQKVNAATATPPPPSQTDATVRKEGARNSVLSNSVLSGGTNYKQGQTAAAYNQNINQYQQQQNEFATSYQLMLQRLAQESGGTGTYVAGATG